MRIRRVLWGKQEGNFRFDESNFGPFFRVLDRKLPSVPSVKLIFNPKCGFTNLIANACPSLDRRHPNYFSRTRFDADGGIVEAPHHALLLLNGDCPVIALFEEGRKRLAFIHAGFRCLVRENPNEPNIIDAAFTIHGFDPKAVDVFVGFGIGSCCFGAEHYPEVKFQSIPLPVQRAIRGPRRGQLAVDLYIVIRNMLARAGVQEERISMDRTCTACSGRENGGSGAFHSNVWDGKEAGRNAALVWFE